MDKDRLQGIFDHASRAGWSIRSDVQLQEWLEGFSEHLKKRTNEVAGEVQRLGTETGNVELHLLNTFNSLRALSATQFIENRVDEADEILVNKSEPQIKQSSVEDYDSQIVPRYKEAVLMAWDAYQGFSTSETRVSSSDLRFRRTGQALQSRRPIKLPYIIGREEFARDSHCGLADFKFPEVNARASSSEPVESDSDTDRDEAKMAAEIVGGGIWLEGDWSITESESSGRQGAVLEPAVSAALDFKAMLEAALRGPSFLYNGGIVPNLENAHGQQDYMDSAFPPFARETDGNTPRTRPEPGENKLDVDLSAKDGQESLSDNVHYHGQRLRTKVLMEGSRTVSPHSSPIYMASSDPAFIPVSQTPAASRSGQSPVVPTRDRLTVEPDHFREESLARSMQSPQGIVNTANTDGHNLSSTFNREESLSRHASQSRPLAVTDSPPMASLPDNLFQGLQAALQARELRSQSMQSTEAPLIANVKRKSEAVGKGRVPRSAEKYTASRLSPANFNLKDNKGSPSMDKGLEVGTAAMKVQEPFSFHGGLFDDDEMDDDGDSLASQEVINMKRTGDVKSGESRSASSMGHVTSNTGMPRQGLFDDVSDMFTGSTSISEASEKSGLAERVNYSQSSHLLPPDKKDAQRTSEVVASDEDWEGDNHEATLNPGLALSKEGIVDSLLSTERNTGMVITNSAAMSEGISSPEPSKENEDTAYVNIKKVDTGGMAGRHSEDVEQGSIVPKKKSSSVVSPRSNTVAAVSSTQTKPGSTPLAKDVMEAGTCSGGPSRLLVTAVTANRKAEFSSDDDTSLSWSNSDGEESAEECKEEGQKIGQPEERIAFNNAESHSVSVSGTEEDSREKIIEDRSLPGIVQTRDQTPTKDGRQSLQQPSSVDLRFPFKESSELEESPKSGRETDLFPSREISEGFVHEMALGKGIQGHQFSGLSAAPTNGSHTTGLSATSTIDIPTSGLLAGVASSEKLKGLAGMDRAAFTGGHSSGGDSAPVVPTRRYRSLFDDEDEEDLFLPRPEAASGLFATDRGIASIANHHASSGMLSSLSPSTSTSGGKMTSRHTATSITNTPLRSRITNDPRLERTSPSPGRSSEAKNTLLSSSAGRMSLIEKGLPNPCSGNSEQRVLSSAEAGRGASPSATLKEDEQGDVPSPVTTAKLPQKTVSSLLFGDDDDDDREDQLFGPLGGRSRSKATSLFDVEDTSGGGSFLRSVSSKLPLTSPARLPRASHSRSRASRRSLFDDGDDEESG